MKKVWILERFETHEEMIKFLGEYEKMLENDKENEKLEMFVSKYKEQVEHNPNGRWVGMDGKSIYRVFCNVAKGTIKMFPDSKFRVVEGEINDDAKYWPGYRFVKENEGVLRYLMATLNKC